MDGDTKLKHKIIWRFCNSLLRARTVDVIRSRMQTLMRWLVLTSRNYSTFFFTSLVFIFIIVLTQLQATNTIQINMSWRTHPPHIGNAIVLVILFLVIAIVSWLFDRDRQHALHRALISEEALKKYTDQLEMMITQRTKELNQAQLDKMTQLYHFAEVGRSLSGLLHDISNPLTVISLNLQQLSQSTQTVPITDLKQTKVALHRAVQGTKNIEEFLEAARQLIQQQQVVKKFVIKNTLYQVLLVLGYKAKAAQVSIESHCPKHLKMRGNPLRFNQVVANLLSNAIDAYDHNLSQDRKVRVSIDALTSGHIELKIQDWGNGIAPEYLKKIFNPLFTTKGVRKGTGLGLSIVKEIVEHEMHGTISVESTLGTGTTFTLLLPNSQ